MHQELKALIIRLPKLITAEFNSRAVPYVVGMQLPLTVPALFAIIRAECLVQAGVRFNVFEELEQVKETLNSRSKLYRRGANHNLSKLLHESVQAVLSQIDAELQVALSALLLRARHGSDLLRLLGTHYSNNMDQDLPVYVQYALNWHRSWCDSQLPAGMQGESYPYPHTEVPVLTFMRSIVDSAAGRKVDASLPWAKEIAVVVLSKMDWLSPTETEVLRITTCRLDSCDVDADFIKYSM